MKINLSRKEIIIFLIIGIILSMLPYLFTRDWDLVNYRDTGSIGDTIGGITAPFLSFFGSILVYLALKAQVKANKLVQEQFTKQEEEDIKRKKMTFYDSRVNFVKDEINTFYYSFYEIRYDKKQKFNYQGSQAIHQLLKQNCKRNEKEATNFYDREPKLLELKFLLVYILNTLCSIEDEIFSIKKNEDNTIKSAFIDFIGFNFYSKIKGNFVSLNKYRVNMLEPCVDCGKFHGLPEELYELVDKIEDKLKHKQ